MHFQADTLAATMRLSLSASPALVGYTKRCATHFTRSGHTIPTPVTRTIMTTVLTLLIVATVGCGTSADPESWAEADESGNVEANFMQACQLANGLLPDNNLNADSVAELCQCSFDGLRKELNFDEFRELDTALRLTPDPDNLNDGRGETARASWNHKVKRVIQACTRI